MSKKKIQSIIKINAYPVISKVVEDGINIGWNHAHKHTDVPSEQVIKEHIYNDVMNELCEIVDFDNKEEE